MKEKEEIYSITSNFYSTETKNIIKLFANKLSDTPFYQNIEIRVYDENQNLLYTFAPKIDYGYSPKLTALDFIGNGLNQIFYSADSGGSGGYGFYYIFEICSKNATTLFDFETFGSQNQYSGQFLNNYRAQIFAKENTYFLDVSKMDNYFKNQIFYSNGMVKNTEINIGGVNIVFPFFNPSLGIWLLQVYQKATAVAEVNTLGYVINALKFDGQNFTQFWQYFALPPTSQN